MKWIVCLLLVLASLGESLAAGYPLYISTRNDNDGVYAINVHNAGSAPVYLSVKLTKRVNARVGGLNSNGQKVLEPGAKEDVLLVVPEKLEETMSFEYESSWNFGRGNNRVEHNGIYRPPFPSDQTFDTLNAVMNDSSNRSFANAIDILMPEGTPVIAARSGFVMDLRGSFNNADIDGLLTPFDDLVKMGNYVRIFHDDGTWAEYLNMKDSSVTVRIGQRVEAGSQIGLSGMTGTAERPQLRFVVFRPTGPLTPPDSQIIKMEMAGKGIKVVKTGDTIGASNSVLPPSALVINDPLVIASVKKNDADRQTGVYTTGIVSPPRMMQILFFGLGVFMAVVGLLVILAIRERKRSDSWRSVGIKYGLLKRKHDANVEAEEKENDRIDFGGEVDLRPTRGFFISDWENAFLSSVVMSLPIGYVVHMKVSFNRLFARPLWTRQNPVGFAMLRSESVDAIVVRLRDNRIVAAIDIDRNDATSEIKCYTIAAKRAIFEESDIPYLELPLDSGPTQIRTALKPYALQDMGVDEMASTLKYA